MPTTARFDPQHDGPDGPPSGNRLRVLIVDDEPDTADTMVILLNHWGFAATAVRNGIDALQAAQAAQTPDVVLLDIGMPGMDGLELAKRLHKNVPGNGRRPFLIAVSGYGDAQTCRQAFQAGVDLHLLKPVDPAELEKVLRRFQHVLMPAAERKIRAGQHRIRLLPTLRFWSEQAMLRNSVTTAAQITAKAAKLKTSFLRVTNLEDRFSIREQWCRETARFLDESEKIRQLLSSFQRQTIH